MHLYVIVVPGVHREQTPFTHTGRPVPQNCDSQLIKENTRQNLWIKHILTLTLSLSLFWISIVNNFENLTFVFLSLNRKLTRYKTVGFTRTFTSFLFRFSSYETADKKHENFILNATTTPSKMCTVSKERISDLQFLDSFFNLLYERFI